MLKTKLAAYVFFGFAALAVNQAKAESIGVNFVDPTTTGSVNHTFVGGSAGAPGYEQPSWNNLQACTTPCTPASPYTGSSSVLVDSAGVTVAGLSVTYSADAIDNVNHVNGAANLTPQDNKLMNGGLQAQTSGDGNATVTLSGLTLASYSLIVYFDASAAGTNMHFLVNSVSVGYVSTNQGFDQTQANNGFIQVTPAATLGAASTATGNFFVVSGLSGSTLTIEATRNNAHIDAIQIVTPEPASLGFLFLGLAGLAGYRKFKRA